MTPAQLVALMDRKDKHLMIEDYRAGTIASMIINVNRQSSEDKTWSPYDFFPHKEWKPKTHVFEKEDDLELFKKVQTINALLGGYDHTGTPLMEEAV